jgi:hypothetical protein
MASWGIGPGEANKTSIPQKLNASLPHLNLDNDSLKS